MKHDVVGCLLILFAMSVVPTIGEAQRGTDGAMDAARPVLNALRLDGGRISVDGRLDDAAWREAEIATGFVQLRPVAGAPASERTEVRVVYDDEAIYVGARLHDDSPDSIVGRLARRDERVYSDWFFVVLDSYHDRRTAFVFGVNPRGVKVDGQYSDDTELELAWDAVWDVAVAGDGGGWSAEFRIPLSQLRFSGGAGETTWGVNFERHVARRDEVAVWSPIPPNADAYVSLAGDLAGLRDLRPGRRLEARPYALARASRAPPAEDGPAVRQASSAAGLDVRYGVTSDLTLSLTFNPDFGQVEADPSVVNLSGLEDFFPERRPFFTEGAEVFRPPFPAFPAIFHSRRIGRAPQGHAPAGAAAEDRPEDTTILGAAKLTGRTAGGWSVGVFGAVTGRENVQYDDPESGPSRAEVEPLTGYAVARIARDFRAGSSALGVIATAVSRALPESGELDLLPRSAYVLGADGRHRIGGGRYEVAGSAFASSVLGSAAALDGIQRSAVHRMHRPDAAYAGYDPDRTALGGYSVNARVRNLSGRWRFLADARARSPGFEVNDVGYVQRSDRVSTNLRVWHDHPAPGRLFRRWSVALSNPGNWNFGGQRSWTWVELSANTQLHNHWEVAAAFIHDLPRLDDGELRGGPALRFGGRWRQSAELSTDPRRPVSASVRAERATSPERSDLWFDAEALVTVRPSGRMDLALGPELLRRKEPAQFVANRTVGDSTHYVRGHIDQTVTALTARLSYAVTPTVSAQVYARPLIAAGGYQGFGAVVDPTARDYGNRIRTYAADQISYDVSAGTYAVDASGDGAPDFTFGDPDFNRKALDLNAVLRWEYRPGSTLFLVWTHGRDVVDGHGDFRAGRDLNRLTGAEGSNRLALKATYWIGR